MTNKIRATPETKNSIINAIEQEKYRSTWQKGVADYAVELIDGMDDNSPITKETLLNGADNWDHYSYGGNALIYDCDIAERLCTPSELKRKKGGELQPNNDENWLDVQARALNQAYRLIQRIIRNLYN